MRAWFWSLLLVSLIGVSSAVKDCFGKTRRSTQDRLLSFTFAFDTELRPTLEEKLLITPGTYGRMIRLHGPHEVGESAVSVHCIEINSGSEPCQVTLTRAQANMDYTLEEHRGEDDPLQYVKQIQILRKDADIPKTTAIAFRDCLRIMIPPAGDPRRLHPLTISDDDRIEFWLEEPNAAPRKGERAENPNKGTKTLIHIGDLLARYVEADPSKRLSMAKQIEKEAAQILAPK